MYSHYKCYQFKNLKLEWDKAIESGNKREWPNWGVGGLKDDACTHMTWDNWNTTWCYFCGKQESQLDKADPKGTIFSHNANWNRNALRCPMYLIQINEKDKRWPVDDTSCIVYFHKMLTYTNIKKFIDTHGIGKYRELCQVFPTVGHHGYNLQEAMNLDLTLLKR